MVDEVGIEDALQDLQCVEEAVRQAERAVRRHKRRNAQLLAQLVHILGPHDPMAASPLMRDVQVAQAACAAHVTQYQRRATLAEAKLQLAELWDRLVVPWFTQCVVRDFYEGAVRRRLDKAEARLRRVTRRLAGRYRWRAAEEARECSAAETVHGCAVDWLLARYMTIMQHSASQEPQGSKQDEEEKYVSDAALRQRRRSLAEVLYLLLHVVPDAVSAYTPTPPPPLITMSDASSSLSPVADCMNKDIELPRDTTSLLHVLAPHMTTAAHEEEDEQHTTLSTLVRLLQYVQGLQELHHRLDLVAGSASQSSREDEVAPSCELPLWPHACTAALPHAVSVTEQGATRSEEGDEQHSTSSPLTAQELAALSALSAACCNALCGRLTFCHTNIRGAAHSHTSCLSAQHSYEACNLSSWAMQYRRVLQSFDLHWEQVTSAMAAAQLAQLPCRTTTAFMHALLSKKDDDDDEDDEEGSEAEDAQDNNATDKNKQEDREGAMERERRWGGWWRRVLHTLQHACGAGKHGSTEEIDDESDELVRLVGCPALLCDVPCTDHTPHIRTTSEEAAVRGAEIPVLPLYRHCPLLYCIEHAMWGEEGEGASTEVRHEGRQRSEE